MLEFHGVHGILSFALLALVAIWPVRAQYPVSGQRVPLEKKVRDRGALEILVPGKPWDLLGQGYQLTADSAVDKEGNVYFTDAQKSRILKIDLEGTVSTWREGTNGTHGVAFGADGRLYGGQSGHKRIVAFSSKDGTESVVTEGAQTHHLTVTSRNEIYFSEGPARKIWIVDATGHKSVVYDGIDSPRGVRASADRSVLVVDSPRTNWVWMFQIQANGSLINGRQFCHLETTPGSSETDPGGMDFDSEGLLYVATKIGVQVCDQQGRLAAIIDTPGSEGASNVFFGGPGLRWLYVAEWDKIYRRPTKRHGATF